MAIASFTLHERDTHLIKLDCPPYSSAYCIYPIMFLIQPVISS
jgi:hypothetical protein